MTNTQPKPQATNVHNVQYYNELEPDLQAFLDSCKPDEEFAGNTSVMVYPQTGKDEKAISQTNQQ